MLYFSHLGIELYFVRYKLEFVITVFVETLLRYNRVYLLWAGVFLSDLYVLSL